MIFPSVDLPSFMQFKPTWTKCLEWVSDLLEWVGFCPPSLYVKVALFDTFS